MKKRRHISNELFGGLRLAAKRFRNWNSMQTCLRAKCKHRLSRPVNARRIETETPANKARRKITHLSIRWPLQEKLHYRRQKLKLNLCVLIVEAIQERLQEFIGVVYTLSVFANDPDHRSTCLWFVKSVEILAEIRNDTFVFVGVLPEDILQKERCNPAVGKVKNNEGSKRTLMTTIASCTT